MTPYEAWRKKKPTVDYFRTFGCVAHVKLVGPGVTKLADRSRPGIFLGYEAGTKGYRVYDPIGKRLYITRDVRFEEDRRWDWSKDGSDSERPTSSRSCTPTRACPQPRPTPCHQPR